MYIWLSLLVNTKLKQVGLWIITETLLYTLIHIHKAHTYIQSVLQQFG